ncbi:uncharacterized protein [Rutidosis leptorrhynchoides]|uniref:uncharacterized protein n=1 Tax=Rutidosis leptorrhynchoides TaxID=125765 RepID=UPI003A98D11F
MLAGKYCPRNQVQKFEVEFWELRMKNLEVEEYNNRFLELAALCPSMVTPESKKIEKYILGLPPQIQGNVIVAGKETIEATMLMTQNLVMAARRNAKEKQNEVKTTDNKRKFEPTQGSGQNSNKKVGDTTTGGYAGKLPYCSRCEKHHNGKCNIQCGNCKKMGHLSKNCRLPAVTTYTPATKDKPFVPTCYSCGEIGHTKPNRPKKEDITKNADDVKAKGRAFVMTAEEARDDEDIITGTFLVNNCYASVLFDTEMVNGKSVKVDRIYKKCNMSLANKTFKVDLLPVELRSFDVVLGMDWLSPMKVGIQCFDKTINIPLETGEILVIQGDKSGSKLNLISCIKTRKYLMKGCQAILAHIKEVKPDERRIEDVPVVKDFSEVFPDELPGIYISDPEIKADYRSNLITTRLN